MTLTREEAVSWHRKMWNWISDRIEEDKERQDIDDLKKEYCNEKGFYCAVCNCFCCEYTNCNCDLCPIEWGSEAKNLMCLDQYKVEDNKGLYSLCCEETDWKEQVKSARMIANLPERENV